MTISTATAPSAWCKHLLTTFWGEDVITETTDWLTQHEHQVVDFDAGRCADTQTLLAELARALDFPNYFGRNLDAFNDCMRDVVTGDYGSSRDATGFALMQTHYDRFVVAKPRLRTPMWTSSRASAETVH